LLRPAGLDQAEQRERCRNKKFHTCWYFFNNSPIAAGKACFQ
jgi:hypothetical protein